MGLITLKKYAEKNGIADTSSIRHKILDGALPAKKSGGTWLIEESEPYPDRRIKSGKYRDWRKKQESKAPNE